jgi:hypothetical protein
MKPMTIKKQQELRVRNKRLQFIKMAVVILIIIALAGNAFGR